MESDNTITSDDTHQLSLGVQFDDGFLEDHAKRLINDPEVAIVELIANSWDAGADRVDITWPEHHDAIIRVEDNGEGMSFDQFVMRWTTLSYNRLQRQGKVVEFPRGNKTSNRPVFGRNGKGRLSMFCFCFDYTIETWKNGTCNVFEVKRGSGREPFTVTRKQQYEKAGHGTIITGRHYLPLRLMPVKEVIELVGSKFVTDPAFEVYVNGQHIELSSLEGLIDKYVIPVEDYGNITIYLISSDTAGRVSHHHGVAWRVNNRLVGKPSWRSIDIGKYLDARFTEGKQYTFIVEANILADMVRFDWTWFEDSDKTFAIISTVNEKITAIIQDLFQDVRKEKKREALKANVEGIRKLPRTSRAYIGRFVDSVQLHSPSIRPKDLSAAVEVLSKMEEARTGYTLLEQLAQLPPDDIDALSELLNKWSLGQIRIVLEEIDRRITLISQLEKVVETKSDELHEIHPLFENGLWIFGPEFESIEFRSNQWLVSILKEFLGDQETILSTPRRRPDLVSLPNSSIELYARNGFDSKSDPDGIEKVLIVELKAGGSRITSKEIRQAEDYAKEIKRSNKIKSNAEIVCFVLGTTLADDAENYSEKKFGEVKVIIYARKYSDILELAHARTFYLKEQIEKARSENLYDADVELLIEENPNQSKLPLT